MEPLTLKSQQPVKEDIECWDDDGDLEGIDDLQFRNVSSTTMNTTRSSSHHRDSISSRASVRSDVGEDDDWQVLLPSNDAVSTSHAIASAKSAGIPIPDNVPTSALLGGTIKRLGGRRIKKVLGDDWGEDLQLPKPGEGGLTLKRKEAQEFPDALRQISGGFSQKSSPAKPQLNMTFMERIQSVGKSEASFSLGRFRDNEDDFDYGDVPTIKVAKNRPLPKAIDFTPPSEKLRKDAENFEDDIIFPPDGEPLKLSAQKAIPKTPALNGHDDIDGDWGDGSQGSLGTSLGGTRRTGRSNRSSSISALSPSVFSPSLSSCLTAESEDELLDCLVLPDGPLKFGEALRKRKQSASPDPTDGKKSEVQAAAGEDFFSDIHIGDGDIFDSGKLTLNRNIKHKVARQTSPGRRPATTLTFTNKPQNVTTTTRIPKLQTHDRNRSKLEPVSESGGPILNSRKSMARLGGHSAQPSFSSSIPAPSSSAVPIPSAPSTPSRRGLNSRSSRDTMKVEPTTTNTQLLKAKRSMPLMKSQASPARPPSYQRPPSRSDYSSRGGIPPRPKTPVDRTLPEASLSSSRKPPLPFLPAGNLHGQSHHISSKSSRSLHRPNSSDSNENLPLNRPISRLSNSQYRPFSPSVRRDLASESLAREAAAKRTLTKPMRRRAFGDGSELDVFDDLPTSATVESKFVKQPLRGKTSNLRTKLSTSKNASNSSLPRTDTSANSAPLTPLSPKKPDTIITNVPRFARDTAASRTAREQRASIQHPQPFQSTTHAEPSNLLSSQATINWKARIAAKPIASPRHNPKLRSKAPQKPSLIKPVGNGIHDAKTVNGMHYNPQLFRWEGNENALAPFDVPIPMTPESPKVKGLGIQTKPALIANFGSVKGVQVVGGMVFDPQRMCWLKMSHNQSTAGHRRSESGGMSPATEDDEEDVFAGLEDLDDGKSVKGKGTNGEGKESGMSLVDEEWLVGEEFDVGPEFVRRQRAEEEKWRRKVEGWVGKGVGREEGEGWKWEIRRMVGLDMEGRRVR